jgi:hypothetical protein
MLKSSPRRLTVVRLKGLPAILLGRLPRELVDVLILFSIKTGTDEEWPDNHLRKAASAARMHTALRSDVSNIPVRWSNGIISRNFDLIFSLSLSFN